jgi:hypothetical protein
MAQMRGVYTDEVKQDAVRLAIKQGDNAAARHQPE